MNGKVLHLGDPGECKQFLDRISPQLHHLVAVQWNTLRYLRYTGRNLFDVPHPLQRQRYHLLDRDPQWHNVFLSKKKPPKLYGNQGQGCPRKFDFCWQGTRSPRTCRAAGGASQKMLVISNTRTLVNGLSATQKFTNPYFP